MNRFGSLPLRINHMRLAQMAARSPSLSALPKTNTFTLSLPPDPKYPTPESSHVAPRGALLPRMVKGGLYTFVRPTKVDDPELLAVSPAALRDLNISEDAIKGDEFVQVVSGNRVLGWEDVKDGGEGKDIQEEAQNRGKAELQNGDKENAVGKDPAKVYPWAQTYGGFQFGQWASQLGDGRALSLFETTNPGTGVRYEVQLKGAGKTPYSRFADGRAVLRSSIREFVVSEALNALGIRSTRALSLIRAPKLDVFRETVERGAIVCRFAESWLRIGTFDLLRARGERKMIRQLADYTANEVFQGWESLPAALPGSNLSGETPKDGLNGSATKEDSPFDHLSEDQLLNPTIGVASSETQDQGAFAQNRYARLYRHIVRLNAATVAKWQLYGFTNGVLNTDNTSIAGLSLDFGPFAFIDDYEPSYSPNSQDHALRYSYRNQPSIIWWNLVRLGEDLGELIGAGPRVDEESFITGGIKEDEVKDVQERGENLIMRTGEEYKAVFMAEYKRGMTAKLGLKTCDESDFSSLFSAWLDILEAGELDYTHSFRRLGSITMDELKTEEGRKEKSGVFFKKDRKPGNGDDEMRSRMAEWLDRWRIRVLADWGADKEERKKAMDSVNPKFVPRNWILDELIQRVDKKGERDILNHIMTMSLNPYAEEWGWNREEEERFCADVPNFLGGLQCSCSS